MQKPGEQPLISAHDDTDPHQKGLSKGRMAKIGAAVTAGVLAFSAGATSRATQESQVINGNAEVSAEAMNNPIIYFKSNERNARISDEATRYIDRIERDMNNHPERTNYIEDTPNEDNNDNVTGRGSFVEKIRTPQGETYTFTLSSNRHGAVIEGDEVLMTRSTSESGKQTDVGVTFVRHRNEDMWSTQISESQDRKFVGTPAEVNFHAAERPNQTGQALQENDNKAIMTARQYLAQAGVE